MTCRSLGKERGRNDHGESDAGDCKPRSPRFKQEGPLDPYPNTRTLLGRLQSGKQFLSHFSQSCGGHWLRAKSSQQQLVVRQALTELTAFGAYLQVRTRFVRFACWQISADIECKGFLVAIAVHECSPVLSSMASFIRSSSPANLGANGAFGGAQDFGDFRCRETFDVAENHRHSFLLRQIVQSFPQPLALLFPCKTRIGIFPFTRRFCLSGGNFTEGVVPTLRSSGEYRDRH